MGHWRPDQKKEKKEKNKYDEYIGVELQIPKKDGVKRVEILRKKLHNAYINREGNGNYRAWVDHNEYEIGFCDGSTSKLTANIISEKVCFQVDSDGSHFQLIKGICDHRLDWCEIPKRFRFIVSNNGNNIPKRTTVG